MNADLGHAHYLGVLENALRSFDKTRPKSSTANNRTTEAAPGHSASDVAFRNLFQELEIEDVRNGQDHLLSDDGNSDEEIKRGSRPSQKAKKMKSGKKHPKGKKIPKAPKTQSTTGSRMLW